MRPFSGTGLRVGRRRSDLVITPGDRTVEAGRIETTSLREVDTVARARRRWRPGVARVRISKLRSQSLGRRGYHPRQPGAAGRTGPL